MVYFKTNWIKDSNMWVIRKIRPWAVGGGILFLYFHFTYYEYLGRRVYFFNKYIDHRTTEEKQADANKYRSRWGYKPRYEPNLEISIKKDKYKNQSLKETLLDTPRIKGNPDSESRYVMDYDIEDPEKTREFSLAILEHSRVPGTFDYTIPQTQHSLFPDVEQEAYVNLNSSIKDTRLLQISKFTV